MLNLLGGLTNTIGGVVNIATSLVGGAAGAAGNLVGGAVNLAGNVAGGVLGTAGNLVGGTVNLAGGLLGNAGNLAGNLVGGAVTSLGQLVGGIVGGAGAIVGNTLVGVGNIVGVIPTILANGVSDGLGFIKLGVDKIDIAGNIFDSNGITGNIFGTLKNVFVPFGKAVDGIVGTVTQIGGNVLTFPLKVVSWFSDQMLGVVGALSKNPAALVTNFITNISNLGSQIQAGINDFFTRSSASVTDSSLKTAIATARDAIAPAIKFIYEQVDTVSKNIYALLDKYNTGKNDIGTAAVNKVSELLAPLVTKFNTIFEGGRATAACLDPIRNSILTYGQDSISYMSNCIDESNIFNATEYAEIALYKVIDITQFTKDVKCAIIECIVPALMQPKDSGTIKAAGECLASVSSNFYTSINNVFNILFLFKGNKKCWRT